MSLRLHENEQHPRTQCFIVSPSSRHLKHSQLEQLVRDLFPDCELDQEWITDPRNPRLVLAILMRRVFGN